MALDTDKLKEIGIKYIINKYLPSLIEYQDLIINYIVYNKDIQLTDILKMLNLNSLGYIIRLDYKETYNKDITDAELETVLKSLDLEKAIKENTLGTISNVVDEIIQSQITEGITGGFSYALNYIQQEKIETIKKVMTESIKIEGNYLINENLNKIVNFYISNKLILFDSINKKVNILHNLRIDYKTLETLKNKKAGFTIFRTSYLEKIYNILQVAETKKFTYDNNNNIFNELYYSKTQINLIDFINRYKILTNLISNASQSILRNSFISMTSLKDTQKTDILNAIMKPISLNFHYDRNQGFSNGIFSNNLGYPFVNSNLAFVFGTSKAGLVTKPYHYFIYKLDLINITQQATASLYLSNTDQQNIINNLGNLDVAYNEDLKEFIKLTNEIDIKIFTDLLINYSDKSIEEKLKDKTDFLNMFSDQNILEKLILFFKENPFLSFIIILILLYFLLKDS